MNTCKGDVCNVDVRRASFAKHLRSRNHSENMEQNETNIPEWLFQEPIEKKIKKYNPYSLTQIARDNIRLDDKQLNEELSKKMPNSYYSTDKNLKGGFKINLDSHHFNHSYSKLTFIPNYSDFGIEVRYT